ncbi:MAG TPA: thiamine phosphate synthase [Acetobacteraceae bacterium]
MLWLFTDSVRLPDPLGAAARLPRGLCGVVLRHDKHPARLALGLALAAICRRRRLPLVVAGDWRLAFRLRAGLHLRGGRWLGGKRRPRLHTSSAHGVADLLRAERGGALPFLSPVFPTASHPGLRALGVLRWAAHARRAGRPVAALGGVDGSTVRRLPHRLCVAVGAIGALA